MVKEFVEGETYSNPSLDKNILVLGTSISTKTEVVLAILWIDPESTETTGGGALTIKRTDFKNWNLIEF